ncbi:ClpXP protease specificity-enhancing factor [Cobetia sp. D5]|uniref:ClpXP protease specificity-enhancing factor n=1 Tax=Cobetia TaxID=204286 RepID=UPI00103A430D|nr:MULTISPECIES: ClpXP protease specificity-enhancing factor [Cobetia]MDO6817061.1 ClpXP protease specificity-enhancing factor [Cobetia amphilecti]TCJ25098.1 ClpXP protease specificity-enhancing factor [Halomonas sp. GDM18]
MLSSRPYLARALYEWLLDNDNTPYIVVDAEQEGVQVPRQHVQNGQIVLNIAPGAVRDLLIANEGVSFNARFGGQPMHVSVPTAALVALYSRENGVGMVFGHEPVMPGADEMTFGEAAPDAEPAAAARPTLASVGSAPVEEEVPASESADASVETSSGADAEAADEEQASDSASDEQGADDNDQPKPPRKGRPSLRVIK